MPYTHDILKHLVKGLLEDQHVINQVESLVATIIATDMVGQQVDDIAESTVSWLLQDENTVKLTRQLLKDTVNDLPLQEQVGYALWESIKVALVPSILRAPKFVTTVSPPPSIVPPSSSSSPQNIDEFGKLQPTLIQEPSGIEVALKKGQQPTLVEIPDDFQEMIMEMLFREAWEEVSLQCGVATTKTQLVNKKQHFEGKLGKYRSLLKGSLKKKFQEFCRKNIDTVFQADRDVIDMGEDYIIIQAKTKLDKKISVFEEYLKKMDKKNKGYIYNSYSDDQVQERAEIRKKIENLTMEKENRVNLLENELNALAKVNPVEHFRRGPIENLLMEINNSPTSTIEDR